MRKLIVVRNGDPDRHENLSESGREKMRELVDDICELINDSYYVNILTSSAPWAAQGAEILANGLITESRKYDELWSKEDHPAELDKVLQLVRELADRWDVLVLVTHHGYVEDFPPYFAKKVLKKDRKYQSIKRGEMIVIDCETTGQRKAGT